MKFIWHWYLCYQILWTPRQCVISTAALHVGRDYGLSAFRGGGLSAGPCLCINQPAESCFTGHCMSCTVKINYQHRVWNTVIVARLLCKAFWKILFLTFLPNFPCVVQTTNSVLLKCSTCRRVGYTIRFIIEAVTIFLIKPLFGINWKYGGHVHFILQPSLGIVVIGAGGRQGEQVPLGALIFFRMFSKGMWIFIVIVSRTSSIVCLAEYVH